MIYFAALKTSSDGLEFVLGTIGDSNKELIFVLTYPTSGIPTYNAEAMRMALTAVETWRLSEGGVVIVEGADLLILAG